MARRDYDVRVTIREEALELSRGGGRQMSKDAMTAGVTAAGGFLQRALVIVTPSGATGHLRQGVSLEVRDFGDDVQGQVGFQGPGARYAEAVEEGTRPHWPPIAPLRLWAARVLGDASAAYPIAAKIAKHGTDGQHMVAETEDTHRAAAEEMAERVIVKSFGKKGVSGLGALF